MRLFRNGPNTQYILSLWDGTEKTSYHPKNPPPKDIHKIRLGESFLHTFQRSLIMSRKDLISTSQPILRIFLPFSKLRIYVKTAYLKVASSQKVRCVFQISKKIFQKTILNLKFKFPANNSKMILNNVIYNQFSLAGAQTRNE